MDREAIASLSFFYLLNSFKNDTKNIQICVRMVTLALECVRDAKTRRSKVRLWLRKQEK